MQNFIFSYLTCFNTFNKIQFYNNALNHSATKYDFITEIANNRIDSSNGINPFAKEFYKALITITKPTMLR